VSLRQATAGEEAAVRATLGALGGRVAEEVLGPSHVGVLGDGRNQQVVLLTAEVLALPPEILTGLDTAGLPIGALAGDVFTLGLQGAVLAGRHARLQSVRVSEHAAQLFLYHRDVLGSSVLHGDAALHKGDSCIVTNPRGETVGIGVVVGNFKGPQSAVRPLDDLGSYLRDQAGD
jgi:ribosome biogenesis protein Nip4